MTNAERFEQIENLITDLLRSHDRTNEILGGISNNLVNLTEIATKQSETIADHTQIFQLMLQNSDRIEANLKSLKSDVQSLLPILEKIIEQDDRLRRLEDAIFKKGA